ncbi:alpha-hydroxy-acid oxidizing protein [Bradyrhizobium genosp. P]|uniref:alpha-hydroxy-acid oxidizing protein n=1 Tax=Bradyrhizobium genosp. P TaxID=83641 RepID=UPI003CF7478B
MFTKPVNVEDYRALAQRRLPKIIFDYLEGGADDETGLRYNHEVFDRYRLMPRRLVDVSKRDIGIELFGRRQAAPFMIGPTGLNGALWPKGDILLARAAERAGIPFVLSTASNDSIEDVAAASKGDFWFQLYIIQRELAEQMVRRAEAAGYSTLVLTTDVGVNGNRERDLRNNFGLPMRYTPRLIYDGLTHPRWSLDFMRNGMPQLANFATADSSNVEVQAAVMSRQMDTSFSWEDLAWLRKLWPRKLFVKGILRPDDAEHCIAAGADGVILSNHGSRQLDTAVSSLEVLAETRARISAPILIDSGYRRGSDIVKALALGANAVLLGRATLYGLAAAGEAGVDHVLRLLEGEVDRTLAQIGCPSVTQLSPDYVMSDGSRPATSAPSVRNSVAA